MPGYVGEVERYERVAVRALTENGRRVKISAHGFLARVFQHEIDHLDGILYIDKLTSPSKLYKVQEGEEEAEAV